VSIAPSNEQVAVAWLKAAVTELGSRVSTELPQDNTIGGTPDSETGWERPVVSVDFWAATPESGKPPWGLAASLATAVKTAVRNHGTVARTLTGFPSAFANAAVKTVTMRTEPRRVRGDSSDYAHYTMDLEIWWVSG
jgi:hypothetical protein